jgi:tetraacyldisaccharide-1-P 4'-kinase
VKINTNAEIPEYTTTHYSHCDASKNKPYIAFSGLGDNKKFELSLQNNGYNIIQFLAYKDHHSYTAADLKKIHNIAMQLGCQIITTEKDFVKIPQELQKNICVFYNEYALHQNLIHEISTRIQEFL